MTDATLARPADVHLDRDELVASGFLVTYGLPTRTGYQTALKAWFQWCSAYGIRPLEAQRAHIELWIRELEERGNRFAARGPKPLMASTDARQIARYDRDKASLARSATWAVAGALEGF